MSRHKNLALFDLGLGFAYAGMAFQIHVGLAAFSLLIFVASYALFSGRRWALDYALGVHGFLIIFSFLFLILSSVFLIFDIGFGLKLINFPISQWIFILILLVHASIHYFPIRILREPETHEFFGKKLPKDI